jgi:valyl-tRNA synthetase
LRLSEYAESARRFAWSELADWYLESVKPRLSGEGTDREVARAVLAHVFDGALRLLHPIVPFITEELWHKLPHAPAGAFLTTAAWPTARGVSGERGASFEQVRNGVQAIRQVRADYNVNPGAWVDAVLVPQNGDAAALEAQLTTIGTMARARVTLASQAPAETSAQMLLPNGLELFVPLSGIVDLDKERKRINDELSNLDKQLTALEGRLANEKFTAKAPPAVVEAERAKATEWRTRRNLLARRLESLGD